MKNFLFLMVLICIILISGCITPSPSLMAAGNGIIITDFSPDYTTPIYTQSSIGLNLEVQNVGTERGVLKEVILFGVDMAEEAGPRTWGVKDPQISLNKPLSPKDPSVSYEGETWSKRWTLRSPTEIDAVTTYDFQVRVKYDYNTTYTGTIRIIDENYMNTLPPEQISALINSGGIISSTTTDGPLVVTGMSGRHFVISEGQENEPKLIKLRITNIGSGFPYLRFEGNEIEENLYQIKIDSVEGEGITCEDDIVVLSKGKTGTLICSFTPPDKIINKVDKLFSIKFSYSYYVDGVTSITVRPVFD